MTIEETTSDFETERVRWDQLGETKMLQLEVIQAELKDLLAQSLEASAKKRQELLEKRAHLLVERNLLDEEVRECFYRRDVAQLAQYELAVMRASEEAAKMHERTTKHRRTLDAAIKEHTRFLNDGYPKLAQAEKDKLSVELSQRVAGLKAEATILAREENRVRQTLDVAKAEYAEVAKELGLGSTTNELARGKADSGADGPGTGWLARP